MDYKNLTAPCGRDCFNCPFYLSKENSEFKSAFAKRAGIPIEKATCDGCRNIQGNCEALKLYGFNGNCATFKCSKEKQVEFCFDCNEFPCDKLYPLADKADKFPHNTKVFNLCTIKRIGVDEWAEKHSKRLWNKYYNDGLETVFD